MFVCCCCCFSKAFITPNFSPVLKHSKNYFRSQPSYFLDLKKSELYCDIDFYFFLNKNSLLIKLYLKINGMIMLWIPESPEMTPLVVQICHSQFSSTIDFSICFYITSDKPKKRGRVWAGEKAKYFLIINSYYCCNFLAIIVVSLIHEEMFMVDVTW